MAKFLVQATYTAEGLRGLQKDKASGRREAITKAVKSLDAGPRFRVPDLSPCVNPRRCRAARPCVDRTSHRRVSRSTDR
jgi:hypothetical protein